MRGIAILLVLLVHLTPYKAMHYGLTDVLPSIANVGWVGVDLFFALSAFLITSILIRTRDDPRYFRNFYARRALRIFPLYYCVLIAELVLLPWLFPSQFALSPSDGARQWSLWIFMSNVVGISDGGGRVLGHLWSLAMEEQYYLAWAVVVAIVSPRRLAVVTWSAGVALLIAQTVMMSAGYVVHYGQFGLTADMLCRFDAFVAGSLLAVYMATRPEACGSVPRWTVLLLATGLPLAELTRRHWLDAAVRPIVTSHDLIIKASAFPLLAISFTSLVALACLSSSWLHPLLKARGLRFLGRYSYGIYMIHGILLPFFRWLMPLPRMTLLGLGPNVASFTYCAVASAITIAAAVLSYRLLERPFLRMKRFFVAKPRLAAPVPTVG